MHAAMIRASQKLHLGACCQKLEFNFVYFLGHGKSSDRARWLDCRLLHTNHSRAWFPVNDIRQVEGVEAR